MTGSNRAFRPQSPEPAPRAPRCSPPTVRSEHVHNFSAASPDAVRCNVPFSPEILIHHTCLQIHVSLSVSKPRKCPKTSSDCISPASPPLTCPASSRPWGLCVPHLCSASASWALHRVGSFTGLSPSTGSRLRRWGQPFLMRLQLLEFCLL